MANVFIKKVTSYFPNKAIGNEDIETYLGMIGGIPSRVKPIILRQNGIKKRYYALDTNQNVTHSNAKLASEAIKKLFSGEIPMNSVQVLACGSSVPDQMLPSHASMVHGETFKYPMEIFSLSGVCLSSLMAFKTAYLSVKSENSSNAVCSASELVSPILLSKFFQEEIKDKQRIEKNPSVAFEKDFLRYMLSDGSAALYLSNNGSAGDIEVNWIETISYANEQDACMYMWGDYDSNGFFNSWKNFSSFEIAANSIWSIKQNVKLLNKVVIKYFVDAIELALKKHPVNMEQVRYVIPHISSMYFYDKLYDEICSRGLDLPCSKWFTNLTWVGNCGSAAIFAALDELLRTKEVVRGDKILLLVPESGRSSYGIVLLTVK
jgi:3-oxoacyl-[acyl-carrier-protein] synthase III